MHSSLIFLMCLPSALMTTLHLPLTSTCDRLISDVTWYWNILATPVNHTAKGLLMLCLTIRYDIKIPKSKLDVFYWKSV